MIVDPEIPLWLIAAGSVAAGVFAGVLLEHTTGAAARRARQLESDLAQAHADLARYRQQTARHFGESAELLGRMAIDYRAFLDHFVSGAEQLCGGDVKGLGVSGLERPLLDATITPPEPPPPDDQEPLADDVQK